MLFFIAFCSFEAIDGAVQLIGRLCWQLKYLLTWSTLQFVYLSLENLPQNFLACFLKSAKPAAKIRSEGKHKGIETKNLFFSKVYRSIGLINQK